MIENKNWLSLHIYINGSIDSFLINSIIPIIDNLFLQKLIKDFFFIRYGEGGIHIRLRINFIDPSSIHLCKSGIIKKLSEHNKNQNNKGVITHFQKLLESEYEPEYERYGGKHGIAIAEKLFFFSSLHVLNIIKSNTKWDYNKAIYAALVMNLIMITKLTKSIDEVCRLYIFSFNNWYPYALNSKTHLKEKIDKNRTIINSYNRIYEETKIWLLPLIKKLIKSKYAYSQDYAWEENMMIIKEMLNIEEGNMIESIGNEKKMHFIYDSYCHMNNNRIGIKNSDESLISFLTLKALITLYEAKKRVNK